MTFTEGPGPLTAYGVQIPLTGPGIGPRKVFDVIRKAANAAARTVERHGLKGALAHVLYWDAACSGTVGGFVNVGLYSCPAYRNFLAAEEFAEAVVKGFKRARRRRLCGCPTELVLTLFATRGEGEGN